MKQYNIKFNDNDLVVAPHKGKFPRESSLIFKQAEAFDLIEQASEFIEAWARSMGHGECYRTHIDWLEKAQSLRNAHIEQMKTGNDFRNGNTMG